MRRVAVAGNQWITGYLVQRLAEAGMKPDLLINLGPEKLQGISGYSDLGPLAEKLGVEIYRPAQYSLTSEIDQKYFSQKSIDVLLVFGWQRLIPDFLIQQCSRGVFGVHGGPEKPPRCRGRAVFNWAILLGYQKFYMYLFQITPGVDEGAILEMTEFDILPSDDIVSVYHKNCVVSTRMFIRHLPQILEGSFSAAPQPSQGATYLPKRTPEQSGIQWNQKAKRIVDLVRSVVPPYPNAFTFYQGKRLDIFACSIFDTRIVYQGMPGEILEVFENGHFVVMSADFPVYVRDYRLSGSQPLLRGACLQISSGEICPDPLL